MFAQLRGEWRSVETICDGLDAIVYLERSPDAVLRLTRVDKKQPGAPPETTTLPPYPNQAARFDDWTSHRAELYPMNGHQLTLLWTSRGPYEAWEDRLSIDAHRTGASERLSTDCRFVERPFAECVTSRRTVYVEYAGGAEPGSHDWGSEMEYQSFDFLRHRRAASAEQITPSATIWGGRIERDGVRYRIHFDKRGYRYTLSVSADPHRPGAELQVAKGDQILQTEPCRAYLVNPVALDRQLQAQPASP